MKDINNVNNVTFKRRIKPAPPTASPPARPEDEPAAIEERSTITLGGINE